MIRVVNKNPKMNFSSWKFVSWTGGGRGRLICSFHLAKFYSNCSWTFEKALCKYSKSIHLTLHVRSYAILIALHLYPFENALNPILHITTIIQMKCLKLARQKQPSYHNLYRTCIQGWCYFLSALLSSSQLLYNLTYILTRQ